MPRKTAPRSMRERRFQPQLKTSIRVPQSTTLWGGSARRRCRRDHLIAAELGDQLLVGVEIGEDDDLADLGVLVARGACRREAAPPAGAAARGPAQVGL